MRSQTLRTAWSVVQAVAAVLLQLAVHVTGRQDCPWDQPGLRRWSHSSTWKNGRFPQSGERVTISSGRRVLLDVSPPPLGLLTIQHGAALIWADVDNLELRSDVIHVKGAFHIGSNSCRFVKRAFIRLTGRMDSQNTITDIFGYIKRKIIEVAPKGTLEIHGMRKTSWTKLAQTIPRQADLPRCSIVYDHKDPQAQPMAAEVGRGYNIIVWNEDGTVFDFLPRLEDFHDLKSNVDGIPNGKVIAMYPINDTPCCQKGKDPQGFGTLHDVVQNDLGGTLITNVSNKDDMYVLLTRKGSRESTVEYFESKGRTNKASEQTYMQLTVWETERVFQVARSYKSSTDCFRVLTTDAAYPILELSQDIVGWKPGDKIVVSSTDFAWEQAEVRELVECNNCTASQIRVNDTFRYMHFGNITYDVDERAEVGLLSRNILIEGVTEAECYTVNTSQASLPFTSTLCRRFGQDTFGGNIRALIDHENFHIQGVELYHMGQQGFLGTYPIHFHMCDNAKGSWARDNSIHHSFQRCVTIHGTDEVEVSGNVCYDHLGHGYFLEDSVEQNNIIDGNLGLVTRFGTTLLSDRSRDWCNEDFPGKDYAAACGDVATFWLTHPNNVVRNNAAGGGVAHGFMYVFADLPLGPSYERQMILRKVKLRSARSTAINVFSNNVAHSYFRSGIFLDSHISTGMLGEEELNLPLNAVIQEENYYEPKTPDGDYSGDRIWNVTLDRFTGYKNRRNNMWIKGGNINVTFCSLADSAMQGFSGGLTGLQTGVSIEYCVFIGASDNVGEPTFYKEQLRNGKYLTHQFNRSIGRSPWATITGVGIYQGPMFVKHCYFNKYQDWYWNDTWTASLGKRPVSYAGAVSFKRDSTYPVYTSQYTTNLTFGFCDNEDGQHWMFMGEPDMPDWPELDGPKQTFNVDRDGSLTGTPGVYTVRNRSFFTGPECTYRPDWHLSVCPYRYVKVEVLGSGGSLSKELKDQWSLIGHRDDVPDDPYYQQGKQRREYLARTYKSYLIDLNSSMPRARFPDEIKVFAYGLERQDVIRIGVCVPKDLKNFYVWSTYPVPIRNTNYTKANSLRDVDQDNGTGVIFHDQKNGIIFFKLWSRHDRTNESQLCVAGLCPMIKLKLLDGSKNKPRECYRPRTRRPDYQPFVDTRPRPKIPVTPSNKCFSKGSPAGLGAVRWNEVGKIVHHKYTVPCAAPPPSNTSRGTQTEKGCFVESSQRFEVPQVLTSTMTPASCTLRCYGRGYRYAGLSWYKGARCSCSQTFQDTASARNIKRKGCDRQCPGDRTKYCGNYDRLIVWTTGLP